MQKINVMVTGLPGNMAIGIVRHVLADERFRLVPYSLTGPDITIDTHTVDGVSVTLIPTENRDGKIAEIMAATGRFIAIDYTHPSAVNENAALYCRHRLPFVMGTTGGDREKLHAEVAKANLPALIAPNMGKPIVGLQAMLAYGAENFPHLFDDYQLTVKESHQKGKADTSGTAKAIVKYFNAMGIAFSEDRIEMERDPQRQKTAWGVPEAHLEGHAWHTYTLRSNDGTVSLSFTHNVNGRDVYQKGTLEGVVYLNRKIEEGAPPAIYSMIDVLKER